MYVRATPRKNKDGSVVRYLQLAHNVWDPEKKRSRTEVLYNFGREDAVSRAALERSAVSLARFLSTEPDPQATLFPAGAEGFDFLGSRPLGGSYALDGLWRRLGIDAVMRRLLKGRRRDERAERVLFALVASRALAPSSKLAAARWICEEVHIEGLVPAREVRADFSAHTSTRGSGVVAFTCTVILLSGVCASRQPVLSLLGRIFNSSIGAAARVLVKDPG